MEDCKMSKVTIAELASILMEKHGLKRTEAELFIRQFVGVINDGLKNDKSVKVKGLGTFKVQAVSARKSVDVNTGEAIVIEGRDKISFTAEAVMRDLVNAPFAQFETVIVNDGVDFSEIDAKHEAENAETEQTEQTEQTVPVSEQPSTPAAFEQKPEQVAEDDSVAEEKSVIGLEPELEVESDLTPVVEEEPVVEQAQTVSSTSKPFAEVQVVLDTPKPTTILTPQPNDDEPQPNDDGPQPKVEPQPVDEVTQAVVAPQPVDEEYESNTEDFDVKSKSYKNTIIILTSSLACVVVFAVVGFFYMFLQIEKRDNRIAHLETQTATLAERMMKTHMPTLKTTTQPVTANTEAKNILADNQQKIEAAKKADKENNFKAAEANSVVETKTAAKADVKVAETKTAPRQTTASNMPVTKPSPSIPSQSAYDKDPRVRTGAYVITGIANTITVKSGQTMASISKAYLGSGMECYIEAVNGGNRELKAGDKIKIPALKTKKSLKK